MSFLPGTYNIQIYQNTTYIMVFVWSANNCCCQGTVGASPSPVDLTGYTAELQIKPYANPSAPVLYDASSNIVLGGVAGTITLTLPASVTGAFTFPSGVYDLILTSSSGVATALLAGNVTITPSVSP